VLQEQKNFGIMESLSLIYIVVCFVAKKEVYSFETLISTKGSLLNFQEVWAGSIHSKNNLFSFFLSFLESCHYFRRVNA